MRRPDDHSLAVRSSRSEAQDLLAGRGGPCVASPPACRRGRPGRPGGRLRCPSASPRALGRGRRPAGRCAVVVARWRSAGSRRVVAFPVGPRGFPPASSGPRACLVSVACPPLAGSAWPGVVSAARPPGSAACLLLSSGAPGSLVSRSPRRRVALRVAVVPWCAPSRSALWSRRRCRAPRARRSGALGSRRAARRRLPLGPWARWGVGGAGARRAWRAGGSSWRGRGPWRLRAWGAGGPVVSLVRSGGGSAGRFPPIADIMHLMSHRTHALFRARCVVGLISTPQPPTALLTR